MITHLRRLSLGAVLLGATGAAACSATVDEPSSNLSGALSSPAELPTVLRSTPDDTTAVRAAAARPAATLALPRDGQCVEDNDATGICSLAAGRAHFYSCAVGGAPPKPLPECKGVGGSTHWCCF